MSRLIDADKFKNWLMENYVLYDGDRSLKDIDEQPTVDAEPVKHGHWIMYDDEGWTIYECSNCGKHSPSADTYYCPICGAKMDEEEE